MLAEARVCLMAEGRAIMARLRPRNLPGPCPE